MLFYMIALGVWVASLIGAFALGGKVQRILYHADDERKHNEHRTV
jgi:hypothetical protein